jgi:hypothetical protein
MNLRCVFPAIMEGAETIEMREHVMQGKEEQQGGTK